MRSVASKLFGTRRPAVVAQWPAYLPNLLEVLRTSSDTGPAIFADCAFPRHVLMRAEPSTQLMRLPHGTAEDALYATFRAGGGSRPVALCTPETIERLAAGRTLWMFVEDLAGVRPLLPALARAGAGLLCLQDGLEADLPPDWMQVRPTGPSGEPTGLLLFMPRKTFEASGIARSAATSMPSHRVPALPLVARPSAIALLTDACRLVTDNGYPSEGEADWAWLWTGPDQMARFALGRVPPHVSRVEIHFSPSDLHGSLGNAIAIQLDGRRVPHRARFASDGSGRAWIQVPGGSFSILTAACRTVQGNGGRQLRACIRRIGFAP